MTESRPCRVLRLIARLNIGGPAIHVSLLSARLNPDHFQTTLVFGSEAAGEGSMRDLAEAAHVDLVHLPELGREISLLGDLRTLFQVIQIMRRVQPTIVHSHTAKAGFIGRLAARLAGAPIVVHTFHGHVFHGYFGRLRSRFFIMLEQAAAMLSDRIITISPGLKTDLLRYRIAPVEKIEIIPLGFDLQPFLELKEQRGEFRAGLNLPRDVSLAAIVGRLVPVKNHHLFLAAARRLHLAGETARFVVIGDGELRVDLEREARALGLEDAVIFTGWRRDLPAIYADLDLVVLTSVNEGTPVSVIEAMAAGCPVVATRVGGVPDVIQDGVTGRLVESGDVEGLARAMREALTDREHTLRMADAARADVSQRYTVEALVRNTEALYERLLREKGLL